MSCQIPVRATTPREHRGLVRDVLHSIGQHWVSARLSVQSPSSVKFARRSLFVAGGAGASLAAVRALPQALVAPPLGPPDAAVRAQLRALATAGAVVLVDDIDAGASAKVTVLCPRPRLDQRGPRG
jgi:hypothetical protein